MSPKIKVAQNGQKHILVLESDEILKIGYSYRPRTNTVIEPGGGGGLPSIR